MKVNEIFNVDIDRLGDGGEGIALIDNKVVFVKFAPPLSNVKIRIDKINKNYVNATLLKVNSTKNDVLTPFCEHFAVCGGCDIQYMDYPSQLAFKQNKVKGLINKFLNQNIKVLPVIGSDNSKNYRNKIQLQVGLDNGKVVTGFYSKLTHQIVPITKCDLCGEWSSKLIEIFVNWANQNKVSVYNEKSSKGLLRNLVARQIGGKLVVTVVINGDKVKDIELLNKALEENFDNYSLYLSINKRKNSQILGDKLIKVYDNKQLVEVDGIKLDVSPNSFFQVNDNVRAKLYSEVIKSINNYDIIIDAYSGVGVLTTQLAKKCDKVFGIEIVKDAVINADQIAANNGFYGQITNILGDTAIILPKLVNLISHYNKDKFAEFISQNTLTKYEQTKYKNISSNSLVSIVLDPPRKGCDLSVLKAVLDSNSKQVIYVSCDPVTLCRDLKVLSEKYKINKVQPFDLFPQTAHVETMVVLSRK